MKSRKSQLRKSGFILGLAPLARIQRNPLNARIFDKGKLERAIEHILIHELPLSIFIDETDLILSGYENFKAAEALELDQVVTKRSILPLPLDEKRIYLIKDGHHAVAALFGETLHSIH